MTDTTPKTSDESLFRPRVVLLLDDLFFRTRLEDVIRRLGGAPHTVEEPAAFVHAMSGLFPVLALVDMNVAGDWEGAIRRCKHLPHTRYIPIYAFGSHVDADALRRARQAGADHAWARSRMMAELASVVQAHLHPQPVPVEGCDDPLPAEAVAGLEAFNRGEYFEQHEHLEAAWIAEPRPVRDLYQGILQVGVAFLQMERGNRAGALKMFRRGLPKLRTLPDRCQGVDVASFRAAAEAIHAALSQPGADVAALVQDVAFPRVKFGDG